MSPSGGGRSRDVAYVLPRHPTEVDRLDIQHYALRAGLKANYLAPVEDPDRILDVGCGTGQWAYELCREFHDSFVVGLDLHESKPDRPRNYGFVRANILRGLPFQDGQFDFVHQRLLTSGVPVKFWATVVEDLARVTRPGGWLELVEVATELEPAGPATLRLYELLRKLGLQFGLDTTGIINRALDRYLVKAGLTDVGLRRVPIPVGNWGENVGSLMLSDVRVLFTRLGDLFRAQLGVPDEESRELVSTFLQEVEEQQSTMTFAIAYGRKPPDERSD